MEASAWGVAHVTLNCVSSALYLRHITALRSCAGVSEVGALYMTNILSILPVIIFICAMGEVTHFTLAQAYAQHTRVRMVMEPLTMSAPAMSGTRPQKCKRTPTSAIRGFSWP